MVLLGGPVGWMFAIMKRLASWRGGVGGGGVLGLAVPMPVGRRMEAEEEGGTSERGQRAAVC